MPLNEILAPTNITVDETANIPASSVSLSNGNYVVTYEDFAGGTIGEDVRWRVLNSVGALINGGTVISGPADVAPIVTGLSGGGFVLAWTDSVAGGIHTAICDGAGNLVVAPFEVGSTTGAFPVLTALSNNTYALTWSDEVSPGKSDIVTAVFNAQGQQVGPSVNITNSPAIDDTGKAVAVLANGNLAFTWTIGTSGNDFDVFTAVYTTQGAEILPPTKVSDDLAGVSEDTTQIAALASGGYVVGWRRDAAGGASEVVSAVYDNTGHQVVAPFAAGAGEDLRLVALANGNYALLWKGGGDLFTAVYDGAGNQVSAPHNFTNNASVSEFLGDTVLLSSGAYVVTFEATTADGSLDAFSVEFDQAGSQLGIIKNVSQTPGVDDLLPSLAALANDAYAVTWSASAGAFYDVKTAIYRFSDDTDNVISDSAAHKVNYAAATHSINVDLHAQDRSAQATLNGSTIGQVLTAAGFAAIASVGFAEGVDIGTDALIGIQNVVGGGGDDTITGNDNDNRIGGGGGFDQIDGQGGIDTAVFSGNRGDYSISAGSGIVFVSDGRQGLNDGFDIISGVEFLEFRDVTIAVSASAPVANVDQYNVNENTPLVVNAAQGLLANDSDADTLHANLFVDQVTPPSHAASFVFNPDGSFAYTPEANFIGFDHLVYFVSDGVNRVQSDIFFNIVTNNPVFDGDAETNLSVAEGHNFVFTPNATDPDGDDLTYVLSGFDAGLFQIDPLTHEISFIDPPDFEHAVDFSQDNIYDVDVQASDGKGGFAQQHLTIEVTDDNDAPTGVIVAPFGAHRVPTGYVVSEPLLVAKIRADDDQLGHNVFTLSGPDADKFGMEIFEGDLFLTLLPGATAAFANPTTLSVTVNVDDPDLGSGIEASATYEVSAIAPHGPDDFLPLLSGGPMSSHIVTYSFLSGQRIREIFPGISQTFSAADKAAALESLSAWDDVSGLTFVEVSSGPADIRFLIADIVDPGVAGLATSLSAPVTVVIDTAFRDAFFVWSHEVGHALSLFHSFPEPDIGSPALGVDPIFDTTDFTVMSYTTGLRLPTRLGPLDINAAQFLYGLPDQNTVTFDPSTQILHNAGSGNGDEVYGHVGFRNVLEGGAGDDKLFSFGASPNSLTGGSGDDVLHGNGASDVAIYSGNLEDYRFSIGEAGEIIVEDLRVDPLDGSTPDGIDTTIGIERFIFADKSLVPHQLPGLGLNFAPVAEDDFYTIDEDTPLSVFLLDEGVLGNDSDPDFDLLTAILITGPSHGILDLHADGTFGYNPDADFNGVDTFIYEVNDGLDSTTATVTITVNAANEPPVVTDFELTVAEDGFVVLPDVTEHAFDPEGGAIAYNVSIQPANGQLIFDVDLSQYKYIPNPDFFGIDVLTVGVQDEAGGFTTQVITVNVTPVNDAPVFFLQHDPSFAAEGISDGGATIQLPQELSEDAWRLTPASPNLAGAIWDEFDLSQNWSLTANILLGGTAAGGEGLAFVIQSQGEHALTALDADGANHTGSNLGVEGLGGVHGLAGAFGFYFDTAGILEQFGLGGITSFQNDASGISTEVPSNFSNALDNGLPHSLELRWNAVTATLSYSLVQSPLGQIAQGQFVFDASLLPPGPVYYGFVGATSTKTNEHVVQVLSVVSDVETLSVTTLEGAPVSGTVTASDIDGDAMTFSVSPSGLGAPAHGTATIDPNTGEYVYTPNSHYSGEDTFTITAEDGSGGTDTLTIHVNVTPVNVAPVANTDNYNAVLGQTLHVDAPGVLGNDSDADSDDLSALLQSRTTDGVFAFNADGSFDFKPFFKGPSSFTYKANDGELDSNLATVTINTAVDATTLDLSSSTTNTAVTLTNTAGGSFMFPNGGTKQTLANGISNVIGGSGNDTIRGQSNGGILNGAAGNDSLTGGTGVDYLIGGTGTDRLTGGANDDVFIFRPGFGTDTVVDFAVGDSLHHDTLDLRGLGIASVAELLGNPSSAGYYVDSGPSAVVHVGDDSITLLNVTKALLQSHQFDFLV